MSIKCELDQREQEIVEAWFEYRDYCGNLYPQFEGVK